MKGGVINASPGQEAKYLMRGHAISILWEGVHTNKQSNCQHVINRAPVIPVRPVAPPVQPVQPVAPSLTPAGPTYGDPQPLLHRTGFLPKGQVHRFRGNQQTSPAYR